MSTSIRLSDLRDFALRTFKQMAVDKGLGFDVGLGEGLPQAIYTDPRRLQQVIKNLLANAFKFTHQGRVALGVEPSRPAAGAPKTGRSVAPTWWLLLRCSTPASASHRASRRSSSRRSSRPMAPPAASTAAPVSGLSISREIARLLGGEISVVSAPGKGSTFTLYLPHAYLPNLKSTIPGPDGERLPALPPPATHPAPGGAERSSAMHTVASGHQRAGTKARARCMRCCRAASWPMIATASSRAIGCC